MVEKLKPYDIPVSSLGFMVHRALWAMIKRQNQLLKESKLSDIQHGEFIVLKVLNILGETSQSQLARVMDLERSGVSRTLSSLEEKGYVERTPLDGKTNIVRPTEKGKKMVPEIERISDTLTEEAFKGIPQKGRTATLNYLTKIFKNTSGRGD